MISTVLRSIGRGLLLVRKNTKLLLVATLLFVFPILFTWAVHSFYQLSLNNVNTAEKLRVGIMHDTLTALLYAEVNDVDMQEVIKKIVYAGWEDPNSGSDPDQIKVTDIRIYKDTPDGFLIVHSLDDTLVGTIESNNVPLRQIPFSDAWNFHTTYVGESGSIERSYKRVALPEGYYYIVSEQDRTTYLKTLNQRVQGAYIVLSLVFVFLAMLAYWLKKQINWEARHDRLKRVLEERDLFTNMIAHELRAPLTAIRGFNSLLQESKVIDGQERRFTDNIQLSTERLIKLVNDFLEVSRIQSGKLSITKQEIDVHTVLDRVVNDLEAVAYEKKLGLRHVREVNTPIMIETDSDRLVQVLTNIVSNAVKYTDRGEVTLTAKEVRGGVMIRVQDTGMGISAEDQRKLFKPFSRVGGVDDKPITGSGLGMWITMQLVEILSGTISLESIKGVGTHVVIKLFDEKDD